MIAQRTIDQVLDLPLEQVIGKYVDLEKKGASLKACCPFHKEKTPSFVVTPAKNMYKCFGCGKGGDNVVRFVMDKTGLSFPDAIKDIAQNNGILLEHEESEDAAERLAMAEKKMDLVMVNEFAKERFIENLPLLDLENLRWNRDTLKRWEIGFAKDAWNDLTTASKNGSVDMQSLLELGLAKEAKNKKYDAFRNRLMFPIYNHRKQVAGFSGRYLGEEPEQAKYINSPESALYNKSSLLFGMHLALESIRKNEFAVVQEGPADVISSHEVGLDNAVAPCGTALTVGQLKLLAKHTQRLLFLYDGDAAGEKAMHKNATMAIEQGFAVDVLLLPDGEDPDLFFRGNAHYFVTHSAMEFAQDFREDYLFFKAQLLPEELKARAKAIDELCRLMAYNDSELERAAMVDELVQMTGAKNRQLNKAINQYRLKLEAKKPDNIFLGASHIDMKYTMPDYVDSKWHEVKKEVLKYSYFTDRKRIFMRRGTEDQGYTFKKVSNFSIRIIQHMEDEKFPRQLVQIVNVDGRRRTFDTPTDDFVTELAFKKMLAAKGNYRWEGQETDFQRLNAKLKDDMGDGRMISILGWQDEGFWVFNNAVIIDKEIRYLDEHGCFDYDGESYYVPSGNRIYAMNTSKFFPQKRAVLIKNNYSFNEVASQIMRVHRAHSMNLLLFSVASCFSDLIYEWTSFFPLIYLYGEPGSGKDNLVEAVQSLFGKPQTAITITGRANTDKAKIRKFAQFTNMIGHMTEYTTGSDDTDQMIKSMWDRVGYERGTIDSSVGTESIQITMSVIFTGNDYPVNDALITRFIGEEMNQTEFSEDEKKEYEKLKDMTVNGYSHLLQEVLTHREAFQEKFRETFKAVGKELAPDFTFMDLADRMIQNAAVLGATYQLTHEKLQYPFTWEEWKANMLRVYERQSNKRSTGSVVAHWWECFIAAIKHRHEPIREHREFSIKGDELAIRFSSVYKSYLKQHYEIYREKGLSKSVLQDKLEKSDSYDTSKSSHRFGSGKRDKSSALVFMLDKTGIKEQLLEALMYVEEEEKIRSGRSYSGNGQAVNPDAHIETNNGQQLAMATAGKQDDLPF